MSNCFGCGSSDIYHILGHTEWCARCSPLLNQQMAGNQIQPYYCNNGCGATVHTQGTSCVSCLVSKGSMMSKCKGCGQTVSGSVTVCQDCYDFSLKNPYGLLPNQVQQQPVNRTPTTGMPNSCGTPGCTQTGQHFHYKVNYPALGLIDYTHAYEPEKRGDDEPPTGNKWVRYLGGA